MTKGTVYMIKNSRASISQTPEDLRPTQTVQITGEAVSEQQPAKPESARAKITQESLEVSQTQTAQALTAQAHFDGTEVVRQTDVAKLIREEPEPITQTTIQATGEFVTDTEEFRPQSDKATVQLEAAMPGHVKSIEMAGEKVAPLRESAGEVGKAEVKRRVLKSTKTTVQTVGESVGQGAEDLIPETERATITLEKSLPGHEKSVEVPSEKISPRKDSIAETGKAEVKQQKLRTTKTTVQTVGEFATADQEEFRPDAEKATVSLETPLPGHVKTVEVTEEKVAARKESIGEVGKAEVKRQKLKSTKTTVQTTEEFASEDSSEYKPEIDKATPSLEKSMPGQIKSIEITSEQIATRKETKNEIGKAKVKQEKLRTTKTTVQTAGESATDLEEFQPDAENASIALEAPMAGHEKSVEVAGEKIAPRRESVTEVGKAEAKQQKLRTTKTTVQTVSEFAAPDSEQFRPDTEKANVMLETPLPGHEKMVEIPGEKVLARKESTAEIGKAEMKRQKMKTTKTTVQTAEEFVSQDTDEFKPETDKATIALEKPRPGSVRSVEVTGEGLAERKTSVEEMGQAEMKQDKLEPTKQRTVETITSGLPFESEDSRCQCKKTFLTLTLEQSKLLCFLDTSLHK